MLDAPSWIGEKNMFLSLFQPPLDFWYRFLKLLMIYIYTYIYNVMYNVMFIYLTKMSKAHPKPNDKFDKIKTLKFQPTDPIFLMMM